MQPSFDIIDIINLLGAVQGVILAGAIFSIRKGHQIANRVLGIIVVICVITIIDASLYRTRYIFSVLYLAELLPLFAFLLGPLLYWYSKSLASKTVLVFRKQWLHFLPFVLVFLYRLPFFLQSETVKIEYLKQLYEFYPAELFFLAGAVRLQILIYLIVSIKVLIQHAEKVKDLFSSLEDVSLLWLRNFLMIAAIFLLASMIRLIFDYRMETIELDPLLFSLLIYVMSFMGLYQPKIFSGDEKTEQSPKYAKSTLKPDIAEKQLAELFNAMETEKLFLQKDITLQSLADQLKMPAHHLSQIINEKLNKNFFDLINHYRVEEAGTLLKDASYNHYSLEAIGNEAGFKAKSTFNTVFKKFTQMTPSEYRIKACSEKRKA